jgi:drug/metabolite transporter (DMT)-like permease
VAIPPEANLQAAALAVLSAALFGAALVTTHSGLKHLDALAGARVSIPSAMLILWVLSPVLDLAGWQAAALGIFALVGLFYPAAVTLLTFEANRRLGPTVTGTVGSTTPLFAVLGAAVFLGESLGARELFATLLIVLGTIALSRSGTGGQEGRERGALWLPWSAAALRALAQVLSKAGLAIWANPFAAALVGYTVSATAVWASALGRGPGDQAFSRRGVAWFAATGVLNGAALLSLYHALSAGPVYLVSPIAATYPVFTLILSAGILREERLSGTLIAGVALTVAGVVVLIAQW